MTSLDARFIGKTYSDFLFRPQRGVVSTRSAVSLTCRFTSGIGLGLPVVSSNMDSVTESEMAKAMALEGGLGIIHRALSIERQAEMVRFVKRSHSAVIESPRRVSRGTSLGEAKAVAARHQITALLVEDNPGSGVLAGLLTNRDIPRVDAVASESVEAFMTPFSRLHVAAPGISESDAERLMFDKRIERLPLVDDERRIKGLITLRDLLFARKRPFSTKDDKGHLRVGAAIGARGDHVERASALVDAGADTLVIDVAHGHSDVMRDGVEAIQSRFPATPLVCGNVATDEGARFLADLGVDAIKVGVGPGRGCRTRLETAAGVPQLQAIREAYCAVDGEIPIIADGGVSEDKDIFLALMCGASSVMLGSALSGTDESPGHLIEDPATHQKRKIYRGMTSPQAVLESQLDGTGGAPHDLSAEPPAEGMQIQVPYKGSVVDVLRRVRGHLQSAVSYAGESSLEAVRDKILPDPMAFLIPLSAAARKESFDR